MKNALFSNNDLRVIQKEAVPHITNWQIAYAARELRQKGGVTLSCLKAEAGMVIDQLSSFSNSRPIMTKATIKLNSDEVYIEIFNP